MFRGIDIDDIVGQTFGRLTVVSYSHKGRSDHYYKVRCSCGVEKAASRAALRKHRVASCGCLAKSRGKKVTTCPHCGIEITKSAEMCRRCRMLRTIAKNVAEQ